MQIFFRPQQETERVKRLQKNDMSKIGLSFLVAMAGVFLTFYGFHLFGENIETFQKEQKAIDDASRKIQR